MRDTVKVFIILSLSFLIVSLETYIQEYVPMSGLLGVMALGGTILEAYGLLARRIIGKFSKIWVGAELLLFILVGAAVDIRYLAHAGIGSVAIILLALLGRIIAVNIKFTQNTFEYERTPLLFHCLYAKSNRSSSNRSHSTHCRSCLR